MPSLIRTNEKKEGKGEWDRRFSATAMGRGRFAAHLRCYLHFVKYLLSSPLQLAKNFFFLFHLCRNETRKPRAAVYMCF